MQTRYFKKVTVDGQVKGILRLHGVVERVWTGATWEPTEMVMRGLTGGDPLMDEISEAEARDLRPRAFS